MEVLLISPASSYKGICMWAACIIASDHPSIQLSMPPPPLVLQDRFCAVQGPLPGHTFPHPGVLELRRNSGADASGKGPLQNPCTPAPSPTPLGQQKRRGLKRTSPEVPSRQLEVPHKRLRTSEAASSPMGFNGGRDDLVPQHSGGTGGTAERKGPSRRIVPHRVGPDAARDCSGLRKTLLGYVCDEDVEDYWEHYIAEKERLVHDILQARPATWLATWLALPHACRTICPLQLSLSAFPMDEHSWVVNCRTVPMFKHVVFQAKCSELQRMEVVVLS